MKEHEIRPAELIDRYLELTRKDSELFFKNKKSRIIISCVACGSAKSKFAFSKHGFSYEICDKCETLYQSPRPPLEHFNKFYIESESSKYWAQIFYPSVADIRREKVFKKRVSDLQSLCICQGLEVNKLIDVGAGYGVFLEEWLKNGPATEVLAIEPSYHLAQICRDKQIPVAESILEEVTGSYAADLVTSFEVLEHVFDPLDFLKKMAALVRPGGYVFISTLGVDGFDIQILWEKSKQISPPHHINFLSTKGFLELFKRAGLENIQISTPGLLDVDIVINAIKNDNKILKTDRFLKKCLSDERSANALQEFLIATKKSSHVWILAQKP